MENERAFDLPLTLRKRNRGFGFTGCERRGRIRAASRELETLQVEIRRPESGPRGVILPLEDGAAPETGAPP